MAAIASYNYPGEIHGRLLLQVLQRELAGPGFIDRTPIDILPQVPERNTDILSSLSVLQNTYRGEDES